MLLRALRRRCPRCGHAPIFETWWSLTPRCGSCGLVFEREQGYWVGAMTINTAVTVGLFLAVFAGGAIATWPDVPWGWLLAATIAINVVVPVVFYPYAKTIWMAIDLRFQRAGG